MTNTPLIDELINNLKRKGCRVDVPYTSKNHIKPKEIKTKFSYTLRRDSLNRKIIKK